MTATATAGAAPNRGRRWRWELRNTIRSRRICCLCVQEHVLDAAHFCRPQLQASLAHSRSKMLQLQNIVCHPPEWAVTALADQRRRLQTLQRRLRAASRAGLR